MSGLDVSFSGRVTTVDWLLSASGGAQARPVIELCSPSSAHMRIGRPFLIKFLILLLLCSLTGGAWATDLWLAVGYGGRRMISNDGKTWEITAEWAQPGKDDGNNLMSVVWAKDQFVVVGGGGGGNDGAGHILVSKDGRNWTEVSPPDSPDRRAQHAMVYDENRERVVLFGGSSVVVGFFADTWEYDGSTWTQITVDPSPPSRYDHAMAYDSIRNRVVLFGGNGNLDDTWEYDGRTWVELSSATRPPGRGGHAMAFDAGSGRVVMFGGRNGTGRVFGVVPPVATGSSERFPVALPWSGDHRSLRGKCAESEISPQFGYSPVVTVSLDIG